MLLSRGVFRVGLAVGAQPPFWINEIFAFGARFWPPPPLKRKRMQALPGKKT